MKRITYILCLAASFFIFGMPANDASSPKASRNSLTEVTGSIIEEDDLKRAKALVGVINQYRREQGLNEIPYSPRLTDVARWHVYDLEVNKPSGGACNLHSWSDQGERSDFLAINGVSWNSCCYTSDHARNRCMWNKPREISDGEYKGNGYEIAARNRGMTNDRALEQWKGSPLHLDAILNRGKWAKAKWKAIGAAISSRYAVVWFGKETDRSATTSKADSFRNNRAPRASSNIGLSVNADDIDERTLL